MKNMFLNFFVWRERLLNEPLAIFLDYDGTLTAIAPTPSEAQLPFATQDILKALVKLTSVKVIVISGRALDDVRNLVPVKKVSFIGSHGVEFEVKGMAFRKVPKQYLQELEALSRRLGSELGNLPGILLEEKPFSLAIHYRKVSLSVEEKVKRMIVNVCNDAVYKNKIAIILGKKVIEIMPPHAMNKGQAAQRLLRVWGRNKYLPIFIGDDRTDETAFEIFRANGLTVKVGASTSGSAAKYYLDDVQSVRTFLQMILYLKQRPSL